MTEGPVLSRPRFARTLAEQDQATPGEIPVADEFTPAGYRRSRPEQDHGVTHVGNVRMKRRAPNIDPYEINEEEGEAALQGLAEARKREQELFDTARRLIREVPKDRRFFLTTEFWMVLVSAAAAFGAERWGVDPDMLVNVFYGLVALAIGRQGQKALRGMNDK